MIYLVKRVTWTIALALFFVVPAAGAATLSPMEELGKEIFFDQNLSINRNQSCAVCHTPEAGWTGPDSMINAHGSVYEGSIAGRFGNRKPPSSAYATPSPILFLSKQGGGMFIGGNFWDGRATGEKLGNPAADQAQGPFLNPVEQALPDSACVVYRVCNSPEYGWLFQSVWGPDACNISWPADIESVCSQTDGTVTLSEADRLLSDKAYDEIALSIAAYEASAEVNAFSSKYDAFLNGMADLTAEEKRGLALFQGKAKCARCHTVTPGAKGELPLFTDFTYDNLGIPRNPENPWYFMDEFNPLGAAWVDLGLGGFLSSRMDYFQYASANLGMHKVPTLRNVDQRPYPEFIKAYGHNGYFKSLKGIVHFYNTRDVLPACTEPVTEEIALQQGCWPIPEIALNMNTAELGDLGLIDVEEDAIVAFLKTLSDNFTAQP